MNNSLPPSNRTILITGATGFIGSRLAALAMARGYSVKTLSRSDWDSAPAVPVNQRYFGSLPEQIPSDALQGVNVVVHCAASVETAERSASAVNILGTIRLAQLAREAGVQSFIFLSSQSARPDALSAYGKTKYAAEQGLLNIGGMNIVILRPGLVTGSGSRGLFQRMAQMVESSPVIPLLGGGRSIVQPIHVDDLCEAIFRCAEAEYDTKSRILNLGLPEGVSLADFLRAIAAVRLGRRRIMLPVPLWSVEVGVRLAESLGISLPISSGNIKGMKLVERMETEADLASLNMSLRPLDEMVRECAAVTDKAVSLNERPVRVLLIGAGRIGLVHALTLSRLQGVTLSGVVDSKPKATAFLRGMGVSARMFKTLDEALEETNPDAAVIATPPTTHLTLTRACLARGMAVMIEKPLAVRQEELAEYERLAQQFPNCPMQVGYVMLRNPQVQDLIEKLGSGCFGEVRGFLGITLLSFIQEPDSKRWEVKKDISGGGALINSGGHVLSMIHAAFGDPQAIEAESLRLYSTEVEDSIVLSFTYPGFSGKHYCSWSINGFPRQENKLIILTDKGKLILTGSVGVFVTNEGEVDVTHQLDFNVGFNLAPDYAGAGFSSELNDLKEAVLTRQSALVNINRAARLESLMFNAYKASRELKSFSNGGDSATSLFTAVGKPGLLRDLPVEESSNSVRRILDLRDLSTEDAIAYIKSAAERPEWSEYQLVPSQVANLPAGSTTRERLRVTVPDFLNQSRLLSTGRYGEVLKQMGARGISGAVRAVMPMLVIERGLNFWVAAMGLLAAGLKAVPGEFQGTLLLHVYLTDLALSLKRTDMLERMLAICRRTRPRARVGIHTNMAAEALNVLRVLDKPVDEVSVLTSPQALGLSETLSSMRSADSTGKLRLVAEVGLAPYVVHQAAFQGPEHWTHGADALLIGIGADSGLAEQRRRRLEQEWRRVFPGIGMPEGVE